MKGLSSEETAVQQIDKIIFLVKGAEEFLHELYSMEIRKELFFFFSMQLLAVNQEVEVTGNFL